MYHQHLSEEQIEIIRKGHRVGNGPGAFFLRPILKTVFGCVWSRDWQSWFAPTEEAGRRILALCEGLEDLLTANLSDKQRELVLTLLPGRDK